MICISRLFLFIWPVLATLLGVSSTLYEYDDTECGVYPSCSQYGEGSWQILEDCHRYINCTRSVPGGPLEQHNMECPGDLVFANEYGTCVEWDRATDCKVFQDAPCLAQCPRVYLESQGGPADQFQSRRLGCFRLSGTLFDGSMVYYQNQNKQYLTPDSRSDPLSINWIVGELPAAFNGGIRNFKVNYIRCPMDGWNDGWEVHTGLGIWAEDSTMQVTCHSGDEHASTDWTPMPTTTTVTQGPTCTHDGANPLGDCEPDFSCCRWDGSQWEQTTCTCNGDNVFDQTLGTCTWAIICESRGEFWEEGSSGRGFTRADHTCQDGTTCY